MSLFRNTDHNGRETVKNAQSAEPHTARRAVRYAAADNTQAALQRQFPNTKFAISQQATAQSVGKQTTQSSVRIQNDFAQAA